MPNSIEASRPEQTIGEFDKALHDLSAFSCGFLPIDNFLKSSLSGQIRMGMVTANMATADDDPAVLGFQTLGGTCRSCQPWTGGLPACTGTGCAGLLHSCCRCS